MLSDIYWITTETSPRLAIMARPRGGDWLEDEVANWKRSGVEIVVSLLERNEVDDLGLQAEAASCDANGIDYLSFPIADRGVPPDTGEAMRFAADVLRRGKTIAIHCRAGIGRSSLIAAAMLVSSGVEPAEALSAIQLARRTSVPDTDAQRQWVLALTG